MIRIGVVGSRDYPSQVNVIVNVAALPAAFYPNEIMVVSGGARGVDTWAIEEASDLGLPTKVLKADWKLGKHAGIMRNMQLVDSVDCLLVFWDGKSPGTRQVISYAKRQGVKYLLIGPEDGI